jgi:hypothetical protein
LNNLKDDWCLQKKGLHDGILQHHSMAATINNEVDHKKHKLKQVRAEAQGIDRSSRSIHNRQLKQSSTLLPHKKTRAYAPTAEAEAVAKSLNIHLD